MPQELYTKHHGKILIEKSWQDGITHIGKLVDGGYVHITGLPVSSKEILENTIPRGKDLDEALRWFAHKDDPTAEQPKEIKIVNGDFMFSDGAPITSVADLVNNLPAGPILDAAYDWFKRKQKEDKSPATQAAIKVAKKETVVGKGE